MGQKRSSAEKVFISSDPPLPPEMTIKAMQIPLSYTGVPDGVHLATHTKQEWYLVKSGFHIAKNSADGPSSSYSHNNSRVMEIYLEELLPVPQKIKLFIWKLYVIMHGIPVKGILI